MSSHRTLFLRLLIAALLITWMAVIFFFSAQDATASSRTSDGVLNAAAEIFVPPYRTFTEEQKVEFLQEHSHPVRKTAHFCEYAALGLLSLLFLQTLPLDRRLCPFLSLAFCFLYASSDEWHQSFSAGRSTQISDILLDTAGAAVGIACLLLLLWLIRRKKLKKDVDNHLTV